MWKQNTEVTLIQTNYDLDEWKTNFFKLSANLALARDNFITEFEDRRRRNIKKYQFRP